MRVHAAFLLALLVAGCPRPAVPPPSSAPPVSPRPNVAANPGLTATPTAARADADGLPLETINLPPGFSIQLYARAPGARSLCLSPSGTLYIGTLEEGRVYAAIDRDGDLYAEQVYTLLRGRTMPNGVAFRNGSLYVAEVSRIIRLDGVEAHLGDPPAPVLVRDGLPTDRAHGWKYLSFGPDGKLYFNQGMPCNVCLPPGPLYGTILRMDPDGSNLEAYARGVRQSVGHDWDPTTGDLWFTDNGRDNLGDDVPPEELNHAPHMGMHFGFPYCHGGEVLDPEFGRGHSCGEFTPPALKLSAHTAPLGMHFYTGTAFPARYRGGIFIAQHGSWNRSSKVGYQVIFVPMAGGKPQGFDVFARGWLQRQQAWGRPVDVEVMPDGSLLVSDDGAGAVYRIAYAG